MTSLVRATSLVLALDEAARQAALYGAACPDRLEGGRLLALGHTLAAEARIQRDVALAPRRSVAHIQKCAHPL